MRRIRLDDAIKEHIERELYTYPATKREIAQRRAHLIAGGDGRDPDEPSVRRRDAVAWSDPTHYAGTALAEDRRLRELGRIVAAIEDTYHHPALPADVREVMRRWYWECAPAHAIAEGLCVSRETVYRLRKAGVVAVAARLGWL